MTVPSRKLNLTRGAIVRVALIGSVALAGLTWAGLVMPPRAFAPFAAPQGVVETVALPPGLPPPVARFYRVVYGERVPVITSAVISGRATVRPVGALTLPARFRFVHAAGRGYRHYIEVTFFGLPVMTINERFVNGAGVMTLPFGEERGAKIDQAANLGMWAEAIWFPSIYVTDPRVRWEPIDAVTALLIVPAAGGVDERFVVRFDEATGMIAWFESMRYQGASSTSKTLWLNRMDAWGWRDGRPYSASGAAIWMNDGKPWAVFNAEDIRYNIADVDAALRREGE
jgi:hypothetical protein